MKRLEQVSLRAFNTFGTEAHARQLLQLESLEDVARLGAGDFRPGFDLVLGGGSNLLFVHDVPGTVYLNRIRGRRVVEDDGDSVLIEAAAGESWHELVCWSLDQGFSGLENLSLIPGLAGAAPIQNIGAYGVELSNLLDSVLVFDWHSGQRLRLASRDCRFSYRDSRFKSGEPERFLILSCRLRLHRTREPVLSYAGLREELDAMGLSAPSARDVSAAVVRLRQRKLPNPELIGNAGSFFKNPRMSTDQVEALKREHEGLPVHPGDDGQARVSAAWMIEACGWKGYREGDAGVSAQHALVLVNHGTAHGREILALSQRIAKSVLERFGIELEREPALFVAADPAARA
jgi:UDP-N-acetylmuramate dehydrogenase